MTFERGPITDPQALGTTTQRRGSDAGRAGTFGVGLSPLC